MLFSSEVTGTHDTILKSFVLKHMFSEFHNGENHVHLREFLFFQDIILTKPIYSINHTHTHYSIYLYASTIPCILEIAECMLSDKEITENMLH
jgi:hypothetical protein